MSKLDNQAFDYVLDHGMSKTSAEVWAYKAGFNARDEEIKKLRTALEAYLNDANWSHPKVYSDGSKLGKNIFEMQEIARKALSSYVETK